MPPWLILSIIRYESRVKWINPGKRVALSLYLCVVAIEKGAFRLPLTAVADFTLLTPLSSRREKRNSAWKFSPVVVKLISLGNNSLWTGVSNYHIMVACLIADDYRPTRRPLSIWFETSDLQTMLLLLLTLKEPCGASLPASQNMFGLEISLKKTEVLNKPILWEEYHSLDIIIVVIELKAVHQCDVTPSAHSATSTSSNHFTLRPVIN